MAAAVALRLEAVLQLHLYTRTHRLRRWLGKLHLLCLTALTAAATCLHRPLAAQEQEVQALEATLERALVAERVQALCVAPRLPCWLPASSLGRGWPKLFGRFSDQQSNTAEAD